MAIPADRHSIHKASKLVGFVNDSFFFSTLLLTFYEWLQLLLLLIFVIVIEVLFFIFALRWNTPVVELF